MWACTLVLEVRSTAWRWRMTLEALWPRWMGRWTPQASKRTRITQEIVRLPRKKTKPPDLPTEAARQCSGEPASCRNHADRSTMHTDVQSVMKSSITPANETENVRMRQNRKSHLLNPKLSDPSVLVDEERLGQVVSKYTHRGTRQWRRWAPQVERSSLDER